MILSIYTNCSMGGMATVYRNRARADPSTRHVLTFLNDHGGADGFRGLDNVEVRIASKGRAGPFIKYATSRIDFEEVRITSQPELVAAVTARSDQRVVYEFHSSNEGVISGEVSKLDTARVDEIAVPSAFLEKVVERILPPEARGKLRVVPNIVDADLFSPATAELALQRSGGHVPLLWVGRFDKGKNIRDFIRVMACLPETYAGIAVVSLESGPDRISEILGDVNYYGLESRFHILLNISQRALAGMYAHVRERGGVLCSTSLGESFGYSVAEALSAGLPAVAYDVGAIGELVHSGRTAHLVPVGDLLGFAAAVRAVADPVMPSENRVDTVLRHDALTECAPGAGWGDHER